MAEQVSVIAEVAGKMFADDSIEEIEKN
jgi:hypothetical protein